MKSYNTKDLELILSGFIILGIILSIINKNPVYLVPLILPIILYFFFKVKVRSDAENGVTIEYLISLNRNISIHWTEIERCSKTGESSDVVIYLKNGECISFSPFGVNFQELTDYINHKASFKKRYNPEKIKQSFKSKKRKSEQKSSPD